MIAGPVWLAAWRGHGRQAWLGVLALAGIALGVAVAVAIQLANRAAGASFAASASTIVGQATHQLLGPSAGLDERIYPDLRATVLAAGGAAAPVIEADGMLVDGSRRAVLLLGLDPFAERPFRANTAALGGGGGTPIPLDRLLTRPGTAVALGLPTGPLRLRLGARIHTLDVLASLPAQAGAGPVVVVDLATAQELLERPGRLDRIDLILTGDTRITVPPGAELVPASRRSESLARLTGAFRTNLSALGLIALLVGMFLIVNTASFSVVRRRPLFARLRAHGATPGQILGVLLAEAALAGLVASVVGAVGGLALAQVLVALVERTLADLYTATGSLAVAADPWLLLLGIAGGTLATVAAAAWPAWEAAATRPALGFPRPEGRRQSHRPWPVLAGLILIGTGALVIAVLPGIPAGFAGMGLAIVGAAFLVPSLLVPVARVLAWVITPLTWAGARPLIALAARAIDANRSRTGIAVAALAVASAAALGMGLMVGSFRLALNQWLGATLTADVYVSAPRVVAARVGDQPLPPALVEAFTTLPGVAAVVRKRDGVAPSDRGPLAVVAFDPLANRRDDFPAQPPFPNAATRDAAWTAFAAGDAFATEPLATRLGLRVGDTVRLATPTGERPVRIAAILVEFSSDQGFLYLDRANYRRWFQDDAVTALALWTDPSTAPGSPAAVAALVDRLHQAAGEHPLALTTGATLRSASLVVFDRTFAITSVIRWLAAGVAVLGLIAALAAVQLERAATTARLRAIGLTPGGVVGLALAESLLTGAATGLLAVPMGIAVAAGLIEVINHRSFGWSIALAIDGGQVALTVALATGAAVVAGLPPAFRAARLSVAEALRGE